MIDIVIDEPNQKQKIALRSKKKHVAYGGARGGGKSWFIRTKLKLLGARYPGIKMLLVRRTYPELVNNHLKFLVPELRSVAKYNKSDKEFTFVNGSSLKLSYCQTDSDLGQYQGSEYDIIFLDEATQLSEWQIKAIVTCMRGTNGFPKRTYYTCNPGGQGHQYIKRLFIDKNYEDGEYPEEYEFIQALVRDNKKLMETQPDYIRQLEALPPKIREAWLNGSWDIYEGQFFEEFHDNPDHYIDRKWTHVIEPFEIPSDWKIYRSFDWGYSKPFSCGWWAINHDGVAFRILELYGCTKTPNEGIKWIPQKVFEEIKRIEREHRWLKGKQIIGIADPAIWDAETGESINDVAAKNRVYFMKADNSRLNGWMQVHYRMFFDQNGYSMMYVFKNCKAFIRTVPTLVYDDHKVEDLDTDGEDHVADEVRYFCMSRPIAPRVKEPDDHYEETPMAMFLDIAKEDIITTHRSNRPRYEVIDAD